MKDRRLLRKRLEGKKTENGDFFNRRPEPSSGQEGLWQKYDDVIFNNIFHGRSQPSVEERGSETLRNIEMDKGGVATVLENGVNYQILNYSFDNRLGKSERVEISPGSLVLLGNDEVYAGDFSARVKLLFFYNDEEENTHIEAIFESIGEGDVPDWASLEAVMFVFPRNDIE